MRLEGEVATRCVNPGCPAQLQRRLQHFASRNALDIKALGGRVADLLVEKGIVKDPLDLFTLDYEELRELDVGENGSPRKFGRNALNMKAAVDAARALPLDRWLYATGIANVGATVAHDVADAHERMSDLPGSSVLRGVLENAEKRGKSRKILPIKAEAAKAILSFFDSEYGKSYLSRLLALGIDPQRPEREKNATEGPLVGVGCVLTGSLSRSRQEYARLIELAGGTVQSAVTSKTRYLIVGENVGATKTEKARELGTEVIDELRLRELLGISQGGVPDNKSTTASPASPVQGMLF